MSSREGFDGKVHEMQAVAVMSLVALAATAATLALPMTWWLAEACIGAILGSALGFWVTPDIDHDWKTMEEYRAERWLGWLGILWNLAWRPYSLVFKHRDAWTHSWRGTLLRAAPFVAFFSGAYVAARMAADMPLRVLSVFCVAFLAAWLLQDAFHYHHDGLGWLGTRR